MREVNSKFYRESLVQIQVGQIGGFYLRAKVVLPQTHQSQTLSTTLLPAAQCSLHSQAVHPAEILVPVPLHSLQDWTVSQDRIDFGRNLRYRTGAECSRQRLEGFVSSMDYETTMRHMDCYFLATYKK